MFERRNVLHVAKCRDYTFSASRRSATAPAAERRLTRARKNSPPWRETAPICELLITMHLRP